MIQDVILLFCIAALCIAQTHSLDQDIVAETKHGKVRGTTRRALTSDRPVYSYFGVPYARTPDYNFRFVPPVDPWSWDDVKPADDENTPFCHQDSGILRRMLADTWLRFVTSPDHPLSENCLTVNVFSPRHPKASKSDKGLPVMVWIHGGSFQASGTTNKLWMLPAFEDVLLVTVNYRLGVFGFLSLGDPLAPGNAGLHDQVKALEWVRDNIASFGGNPDSVTLVGASAGGFAASSHALSPLSKGLFHRVVAMSGVATLPFLWSKNQDEKTRRVANNTNCLLYKKKYTVTCLCNRVTSSELIKAAKNERYSPEVDGHFFLAPADQLLEKGAFNKVPLMVGSVTGEFDFMLSRKLVPKYYQGFSSRDEAESVIASDLAAFYPNITDQRINSIYRSYLGDDSVREGDKLLRGVLDYFTDSWFNAQADKFASRFSEAGADVFVYKFAHRPTLYNDSATFSRPHKLGRPDHKDDFLFHFGFPFLPGLDEKLKFDDEERKLSRQVMKALANFAKSGNPSSVGETNWGKYPAYLLLNRTVAMATDILDKRSELWEAVFERKVPLSGGVCDQSRTNC